MFPWTKALGFNIQAEGQGSPRQAIVYRHYPFSEQKQQESGGIGRVGGREMQEGRDMGTYVYV